MLYGNKYLVSECVFKLVYDCQGSRSSEIFSARNLDEKSLSRFLLMLILKSSYSKCTAEKGVLKNSQTSHENIRLRVLRTLKFIKRKFQRSYLPVKFVKFSRTPILKNIFEWLFFYLQVILFTMQEKDTAKDAWLESS